jgi:ribonuclease T1
MIRLAGPVPVRAALLALVCVSLAVLSAPSDARAQGSRGDIEAAALPREARDVLVLIHAGGPFRFERDGVTFGNRERSLPSRKRGYYHEYTVATPGVRTRGAWRIVCGGARTAPEVCYYSDDHYATFRRIRE